MIIVGKKDTQKQYRLGSYLTPIQAKMMPDVSYHLTQVRKKVEQLLPPLSHMMQEQTTINDSYHHIC
jgi:hypothetical protein